MGAASGIGAAIAERLRADSWNVFGVDLQGEVDLTADLTERAANERAVAAAVERFARGDPNAGFQHVAPVEELDEDRWDALVALLLASPFVLARYAWPYLRESGRGRFVVIASVHALVASPYKAAYVSAKHGVLGLVKTLALEGAEDRISVSAVCPGYVRTPLVDRQLPGQAAAHGIPEEQVLEEVTLAPHAIQAPDRAPAGGGHGRVPGERGRSAVHRRADDHGSGLVGSLRPGNRLGPTNGLATAARGHGPRQAAGAGCTRQPAKWLRPRVTSPIGRASVQSGAALPRPLVARNPALGYSPVS
jgi:3-hydroxybutyrate dehydrogenase